jgi:hypothetical protein
VLYVLQGSRGRFLIVWRWRQRAVGSSRAWPVDCMLFAAAHAAGCSCSQCVQLLASADGAMQLLTVHASVHALVLAARTGAASSPNTHVAADNRRICLLPRLLTVHADGAGGARAFVPTVIGGTECGADARYLMLRHGLHIVSAMCGQLCWLPATARQPNTR